MRRRWLGLLVVIGLASACGGGSSADEQAFCERLGRLADNDPFQAFGDRATPQEIEAAFEALVTRADELEEVAPDEARPAARDYADAAEALDDLLAAAAFDGDQVDARAYREEQVNYAEAATRLERYLEAEC